MRNEEEGNSQIDMASVMAAANQQSSLSSAAQVYLDEQSQALAEKQLDVKKLRKECFYLLSQYVWNPDGDIEWAKPKDERKNVFTKEGVDKIMTIIHFYINENNLLSNFKEEEVRYLMLKCITEINDLILLKYEFLFRQPDFDECKEILDQRVRERAKIKTYVKEVIGEEADEDEIKKQLFSEIENKIEYEIRKIKDEQKRQRIREYSIIITQLEVIILGALNRALNGEERGSLRRHTQMLEMLGGSPQSAKETGGMFKWLKGN